MYVGTYNPTSSWDISVEYNSSDESSELYNLIINWKVNELIFDLWTIILSNHEHMYVLRTHELLSICSTYSTYGTLIYNVHI